MTVPYNPGARTRLGAIPTADIAVAAAALVCFAGSLAGLTLPRSATWPAWAGSPRS
ncbi:hypothetical protein ACFQ1L_43895 [Phytohabitans flavus]|uniref:hypothetical protein n=1 Tax=Phytohabitans flavus TaxID=1076124 RepID=UPI00363C3D40